MTEKKNSLREEKERLIRNTLISDGLLDANKQKMKKIKRKKKNKHMK